LVVFWEPGTRRVIRKKGKNGAEALRNLWKAPGGERHMGGEKQKKPVFGGGHEKKKRGFRRKLGRGRG